MPSLSNLTSFAAACGIVCIAVFFMPTREHPVSFHAPSAEAATVEDLRKEIADTNAQIEEIQREIDRLSPLLNSSLKQTQTLQSALNTLELTNKKLAADLALTTSRVSKANLTLSELGESIQETESKIAQSSKAVAQGIRNMEAAESQSVVEELLNQRSISEAWDQVNALRSVQSRLTVGLDELKDLKDDLSEQKASVERERSNLSRLQKDLSGQKTAAEATKAEQARLLAQAKSSAAAYQAELNAKLEQKRQFEQELFETESLLKITIDPSAIPDARSGVMSWPLDNVFITQNFGKTSSSGRLYTSGTHNGVDFRAAVGTPVKSVLAGVVWATGNTDLQRGCYSYGKWVLVRHPNGLTSLYGHLSAISVSEGETVGTGDRIGFSGNTGYSTGPHLHLGVFATQGVQVEKYSKSTYCKNTVIPLADVKAYLDPLAYLPSN